MSELTESEQMRLYRRFRQLLKVLTRKGLTVNDIITTVDGRPLNTFEALALEFGKPYDVTTPVVVERYKRSRANFSYGFPYTPDQNMADRGTVPVFDIPRSAVAHHMPYYDHMSVTHSMLQTQTGGLAYLFVANVHILVAVYVDTVVEEWLTGEEPSLSAGGAELMSQRVSTKTMHIAHQPVEYPSRVVQLPLYQNPTGQRTTLDIGGLEDLFRAAVKYAVSQRYGNTISANTVQQDIEREIMESNRREVMLMTERGLSINAA